MSQQKAAVILHPRSTISRFYTAHGFTTEIPLEICRSKDQQTLSIKMETSGSDRYRYEG